MLVVGLVSGEESCLIGISKLDSLIKGRTSLTAKDAVGVKLTATSSSSFLGVNIVALTKERTVLLLLLLILILGIIFGRF